MGSVTFIIIYWHGDYNFGIHRYAEEYPNVQFVAHRFTGGDEYLPGYYQAYFEKPLRPKWSNIRATNR